MNENRAVNGMNYNQKRKKLEEILVSKEVEKEVIENEDIIFEIIPELKYEKGFDQKNKYHCYDVWNHTINALKNSRNNIEIRLALLLHDIGKPFSCQEDGNIRHFKGHAEYSAKMAKLILERLGYNQYEINELCFLISNHATTIQGDTIKKEDIEKYKKLLYIQYCDASAYAPEYANQIVKKLDLIKVMLKNKDLAQSDLNQQK